MKRTYIPLALATLLGITGLPTDSQNRSSAQNQTAQSDANAPSSGTRFLAALDDTLNTKDDKDGKKFEVTTLEPVVACRRQNHSGGR